MNNSYDNENRPMFETFALLIEKLEANGEVFDDSLSEVKRFIATSQG